MPKPNHFDHKALPKHGADWDDAVVVRGVAMADGTAAVRNPRRGRPSRIIGQIRGTSRVVERDTPPGADTLILETDVAPGEDFALLMRYD